MLEETVVEDGCVVVPAGFRAGANRRRAGEDVARGQQLFAPGQQLSPRHLGVAAELGLARLRVFAPLRVALLSSGDELTASGSPLPHGGVYDANRPILRALLARLPVTVTDLGILRDDAQATGRTLQRAAATHDVILASGGASRSEADHVVRTIAEAGHLAFWQVRMKPGRPLATGRLGRAQFIGLPGNPVAATVCFLLLARPAMLRMAGGAFAPAPGLPVPAGFALRKRAGRAELLRTRLVDGPDGTPRVERILREGSGILTSLTDADGLVEIPEEVTTIEPGQPVRFMSFTELGAGS
jgi:molybdopterin molybdotransferase